MRIWDIAPGRLCRQHLLGEHRELHAIWSVLVYNKKGYSRHPETLRWKGKLKALFARHSRLVEEMQKRGYRHNSRLDKRFAKGASRQTEFINTPQEQIEILKRKKCGCISMSNKYLVIFILFLTIVLSGCATTGQIKNAPVGSLQNPIIDSNITLAQALEKPAPDEIRKRQRLVEVLYYSFDGKVHKGQVVINSRLVKDIKEVFKVALKTKFPIKSAIPISSDVFFANGKWNEDNQSMMSNNTAGFNYRKVTGGDYLSNHAYGCAIDINPVQNPYIKGDIVLPGDAVYDINKVGTLAEDSPVVKTFKQLGWKWGGNYKDLKDYQHFEKVLSQ